MADQTYELEGHRIYECAASGPLLRSEADAVDVLGAASAYDPAWIVIPAARLDPEFFELRTRIAGAFLQKFSNYRRRVAIIGDISGAVSRSKALHDFVVESNRSRQVWFLDSSEELAVRLRPRPE